MNSQLVLINDENREKLINLFLLQAKSSLRYFRYFSSRDLSSLDNHVVTYVLKNKNIIIGYCHLDLEQDKVWLGICICPDFKGKGYGQILIKKLIQKAIEFNIEIINLSVDKKNHSAINLYKKFGFRSYNQNNKSYFMNLTLK